MNLPRPPFETTSWQEADFLINYDTDNYSHIDLSRGSKLRRSSHIEKDDADDSPTGKHVIPGPQSSAAGTGRSDTCVDMCRRWTLMESATLATFSNRRKPECPERHFPRTPANTKKSLQTISRLKTLSKHGGFLLSHLVWQYHRR